MEEETSSYHHDDVVSIHVTIATMADVYDGGDDVFVYLGGEQEVPRNVTHVIIDRSVKIFQRGHSINVF